MRNYHKLKQEGKHFAPKNYVFVGKGSPDGELSTFWGYSNLYRTYNDGGYNGDSPDYNYFVPEKLWAEKFPNRFPELKIDKNYYGWWIALNKGDYLISDGTIGKVKAYEWNKLYYPTKESAETAFANYLDNLESPNDNTPMNKKETTLSEIKKKFEAAKKLIGKTVKRLEDGEVHKINSCQLAFAEEDCGEKLLPKERVVLNELGYLIIMWDDRTRYGTIYEEGHYEIILPIIVKNIRGESYTAEDKGDCWKFGCALIDRSLIKEAYDFLLKFGVSGEGNRNAKSVRIGDADFDLETLGKLVES